MKKPGNRTPPRHKRKRQKAKRGGEADTVLKLVKQGVRRFVLKNAPIGDFQKALRAASGKGELSSHPLTGIIFRRIVKEAIRERKRRIINE